MCLSFLLVSERQRAHRSYGSEATDQKLCPCKSSERTDVVIGNIAIRLAANMQRRVRMNAATQARPVQKLRKDKNVIGIIAILVANAINMSLHM